MMHREGYAITLAQWYDFRSRLHARTLFSEHKFAAREISARFRKKECHLDWKDMLSIKILVKAVVITRPIMQKQWGGAMLPRIVASLYEVVMFLRITNVNPHGEVPLVGEWRKAAIKRSSQPLNDIRQWIAEVLVLAAPKAVSRHDNTTAKQSVIRIQASESAAFFRRKNAGEYRASLFVQVFTDTLPIESFGACDSGVRYDGIGTCLTHRHRCVLE
jgi:hypothetical protein